MELPYSSVMWMSLAEQGFLPELAPAPRVLRHERCGAEGGGFAWRDWSVCVAHTSPGSGAARSHP